MRNPPNHVLIIEDSLDLIEALETVFDMSGYQVTVCTNCSRAYQALESKSPFDLVICDYQMQQCNGLEILQRCREIRPRVPFILLTGAKEKVIEEHLLKAGRATIIQKPVSFKELLAQVEQFLSA